MGKVPVDNQRRPVRVLVIADDLQVVEMLHTGLTYAGFEVSVARTEKELFEKSRVLRADLALVDLKLPGGELARMCKELRSRHDVGVLVLSTDGSTSEDHECRPDGQLAKPFAFHEMLALVHAILDNKPANLHRILNSGDLTMDRQTRTVTYNGRRIELTHLEFNLLEFFLTHPGQIFSRQEIFREVWGFDYFGDTNVVDVHLGNLRRKLGNQGGTLIRTFYKRGYGLEPLSEPR
jgi:DNA-binding response OmpR family regulator